mgnify:FL=1
MLHMDPADLMVDGDFLEKLLSGSFEVAMGLVDEAVVASPEKFGGSESVEVRSLGTFPGHVIVVNSEGKFFRAAYSLDESGDNPGIKLGAIESIEVPVLGAVDVAQEARRQARDAVDAMLQGDEKKAKACACEVYSLVQSGTKLTAEGAEDGIREIMLGDADWKKAVRKQESQIKALLGGDILRLETSMPRKRYDTKAVEESDRGSVASALRGLAATLSELLSKTIPATRVTDTSVVRGAARHEQSAADFVGFVREYRNDLASLIKLVEGAAMTTGCLPCLARSHDLVAERIYDWALAGVFAERFARQIEV